MLLFQKQMRFSQKTLLFKVTALKISVQKFKNQLILRSSVEMNYSISLKKYRNLVYFYTLNIEPLSAQCATHISLRLTKLL